MKALITSPLLAIAQSQLGVRESNDNSGVKVQEYQSATTLGGTHWPWCAAFVAWCLKQTAKKLDITIPWSNAASCDVILADARSRGLLVEKPEPGDVFLIRARLKNGQFSQHDMIHTGIVETVKSNGTFTEIAGNTNNDGASEGIGVMRTTRILSDRYYFVRAVDGVSDQDLAKLSPASAPVSPARAWSVSVQMARGSSGSALRGLPCRLDGNRVLVAIRDWANVTGQQVEFVDQTVKLSGHEVALQARIFDGHRFYPMRELCEMSGGLMMVNSSTRTIKAVFA